ncbi:hypothetical protein [Streptosporangium sp. H16]|uniref:hypothetical protein n=1 Tax=Streptosporangium sp. H16 TaxID=3444184 RepID=UPI003F7A367A
MRVGFLPRRLALVVEPQPDESFSSWVDRMAVRNGEHDFTYVDDRLYYFWGPSPVISGTIVNDTTSSLSNGDDRCRAVMWTDINSGGAALVIPYSTTGSGFDVNDLRPYDMNDSFSSNGWQDCI